MDKPDVGSALDSDLKLLAAAMAVVNTRQEAIALLSDLCTPREVTEMARRLRVARLLSAGRTYTQVQQATGASSTTVSRVSRTLASGQGGYAPVVKALDLEDDDRGAPNQQLGA
ncbi:YerC/YecD family TrpR-related protein [Olsenella sp. YH-ols2217]|uniref:YerC/YecD family TrpR-related protein n=1 Tax=Kribbibacterium absianum TaxID=3044210 RepID=A0ABT6ZHQ8_9ACTN|nr:MULTISPECIES: YerC/YecD family TrpR-related protein [unclassified Olsenella]MDJ1121092.1 YerC/YecD family TrpR-related protein [Olsenella sp. YH-ols2216]MDJ1128583.1 YerC/YecD family TrpR-related protein [Olsenella sp. YH-ols2217]